MDLEKELRDLGVEKGEARRVANLIESMNQSELLCMIALIKGLEMGERIERTRMESLAAKILESPAENNPTSGAAG